MSRDRAGRRSGVRSVCARVSMPRIPRVAFFCRARRPSASSFSATRSPACCSQHGRFQPRRTAVHTWAILAGSAVGLVASALGRLYSSTFYALRDTRTPLRFALVRVVLTGVLGYLFAFPLAAHARPRRRGPARPGSRHRRASPVGSSSYSCGARSTQRIGRTGMPRAAARAALGRRHRRGARRRAASMRCSRVRIPSRAARPRRHEHLRRSCTASATARARRSRGERRSSPRVTRR